MWQKRQLFRRGTRRHQTALFVAPRRCSRCVAPSCNLQRYLFWTTQSLGPHQNHQRRDLSACTAARLGTTCCPPAAEEHLRRAGLRHARRDRAEPAKTSRASCCATAEAPREPRQATQSQRKPYKPAAEVIYWRKPCTCAALCAAFCLTRKLCPRDVGRRGNRGKRRSRNASHTNQPLK